MANLKERDVHPIPLAQRLKEIDLQEDPVARSIYLLERDMVKFTLSTLIAAIEGGYLNLEQVRTIIDFGAGSGGPTLAMVRVGEAIGAEVEAVEKEWLGVKQILRAGILPPDKLHHTDGIEFLRSRPNQYDLITACNFGPKGEDKDGSFFVRFAPAAALALTTGGTLMLFSDPWTMTMVELEARRRSIQSKELSQLGPDFIRHTLFFRKEALLEGFNPKQ